jgi:diguanylate cyclase (GGDEF)-like protein
MANSSAKEEELIARFERRFDGSCGEGTLTLAEGAEIFDAYKKSLRRLARIAKISDSYQSEVKSLVLELQDSAANVKVLKGIIPVCASCKKVRNDEGYWRQLEQYLTEYSDAVISHGLCPDCAGNYRALACLGQQEDSPPRIDTANLVEESDIDDPVVTRFLPTLNNKHFATTPLYGDFALLFQKYVRLARRLKRIARISDSYQFQLQDLKTRFEHSSRIDYLTGLPNRLDMYSRLEVEQSRSLRHGTGFSLIMADIDHFKVVNDVHGHALGDRLLVMIARAMASNLRNEDSCARWGGEEFLVLLPEAGREAAICVSERLRTLAGTLEMDTGTTVIRVSLSLGSSVYRSGEPVDACIKRADDALYQAKNGGRNRSIFVE